MRFLHRQYLYNQCCHTTLPAYLVRRIIRPNVIISQLNKCLFAAIIIIIIVERTRSERKTACRQSRRNSIGTVSCRNVRINILA